MFDRRRRDPLWKINEKLSGEDKISKNAVDLFYQQIDGIIKKRLDAIKNDTYKPNPDAGVDLLDLFLETSTDPYQLSGMMYGFLAAGRKLDFLNHGVHQLTTFPIQATRLRIVSHGS